MIGKLNWRPSQWRTSRWFRPIHYRGWEMLVMRVLMALVVFVEFPKRVSKAEVGKEVGMANFVSLDWLAGAGVLDVCRWILLGALVLYAAGRLMWVALPVMAFLTIAPATLDNSQGADHHHLQLLGLALLMQLVWYGWRTIAAKEWWRNGRRTQVLGVFYTQQVIVAAYLTTAIWKIYKTNFGWIRESKYFPVQLVKTRDARYYDKLESAGAESSGWMSGVDGWFAKMSPHIEAFLFANPNICRLVIGSGLVIELLAFLALIGRKSRFFYGGLLVVFHLVIGRVMNLNFETNILLLVVFFVNVPWLVMLVVGRRARSL